MGLWPPWLVNPDGLIQIPTQHTEAELKLIWDLRRINPSLRLPELWQRLKKRGYTHRLFRVLCKLGWASQPKPKKPYRPKPYKQMTYPGQRVQIDVIGSSVPTRHGTTTRWNEATVRTRGRFYDSHRFFDEDLYQELLFVLLRCIKNFKPL